MEYNFEKIISKIKNSISKYKNHSKFNYFCYVGLEVVK
jgi:hypothetical protein